MPRYIDPAKYFDSKKPNELIYECPFQMVIDMAIQWEATMLCILIVRPGFTHERLYYSTKAEAIKWADHLMRVDSSIDSVVFEF